MIITIQHKEEIEVNEVVIETALVKALSMYYGISALNGEVEQFKDINRQLK